MTTAIVTRTVKGAELTWNEMDANFRNLQATADGAIPVVNGTWTPVITAGSGAFTTVSASGFYNKIGNTYFIRGRITITNVGTAAIFTLVSLPAVANGDAVLLGREFALTGVIFSGQLESGSSVLPLLTYNNFFGLTNNSVLIFSGSFNV